MNEDLSPRCTRLGETLPQTLPQPASAVGDYASEVRCPGRGL